MKLTGRVDEGTRLPLDQRKIIDRIEKEVKKKTLRKMPKRWLVNFKRNY
jgi:hypothetical protein